MSAETVKHSALITCSGSLFPPTWKWLPNKSFDLSRYPDNLFRKCSIK